MNLFRKPSSDWTDDELVAGLAVLVTERDVAVANGEPDRAEWLNDLAIVLADERDSRRRLARDVDDAMNPFRSLGLLD